MPEVPTVAESGIPGYDFSPQIGVLAPAGTPGPIVQKLAAEIGRAARHPEIVKRYADLGIDAVRLHARGIRLAHRVLAAPLRGSGEEDRREGGLTALKVAVAGAGPAGLFFSLLLKRKRPDCEITVFEQNPRDATFGFGVVFSRGALEFLARDEPQMHARLAAAMESWPMQRIVHRDVAVDIDGNGFSALGRLELLRILQRGMRSVPGCGLHFDKSLSAIPAVRPGGGRRRRQFACPKVLERHFNAQRSST